MTTPSVRVPSLSNDFNYIFQHNVTRAIYRKWPNHFISTESDDTGAGRSSVVRAFAHGAVGRRIDPSWGGPIELFLVQASAPRLV